MGCLTHMPNPKTPGPGLHALFGKRPIWLACFVTKGRSNVNGFIFDFIDFYQESYKVNLL